MNRFLFLLLSIVSFTDSASQNFKFYLDNKDIELHTFDNLSVDSKVKVVFINPTNYKFKILSIQVLVGIPFSRPGSGAQGSGPSESLVIKEVTANNKENLFSNSPSFSFSLKEILERYPNRSSISFKVKELASNSSEGNNWIEQKLFFKEVFLKMSIKTDPHMKHKGEK